MAETIEAMESLTFEQQELDAELVAKAREEGVELTGPNGLLTGLTKQVLESALEAELAASEPQKFQLPSSAEMRFNWVHADLAALDRAEARELVVDAWRMVVPQKLSRAYDLSTPHGPG